MTARDVRLALALDDGPPVVVRLSASEHACVLGFVASWYRALPMRNAYGLSAWVREVARQAGGGVPARQAAAAAGLPLATWLRRAMLGGLPAVRPRRAGKAPSVAAVGRGPGVARARSGRR